MNFKGTKKLYIIYRYCTLTLQSTPPHSVLIQLQREEIGGGALPPQNQFRFTPQYASCFTKFWPNYVIFTILFQAWSKVLSPISNLAGLALQSQNMMRAATQENAFGLCVTQSVLLNGGSLKAYCLYTVHISLYISLFQIRKYSYIAYDNSF